jgi:hypothetical protein
MKVVRRRASPQTNEKQPALMKAIKRRASPQTKAKKKKPKTTTVTSDSDSSFKEDVEDEELDDADQDADVDDEEKDDADENADKYGNTNDEASDKDNEVYKNVLWDSGGEMVFVKQVARIIAIADNQYPGFMLNSKQMNDALQREINLS